MKTTNRLSRLLRAFNQWFGGPGTTGLASEPVSPDDVLAQSRDVDGASGASRSASPDIVAGNAAQRADALALPPLPTSVGHRRADGWEVPPPKQLVAMSDDLWASGDQFELFVLDASESMFRSADGPRRIDTLLEELGRFTERVRRCRRGQPRVAVIWFTGAAYLGSAWTNQLEGLHDRLMSSLPLPGATNFTAALRAAHAMLTTRAFPVGAFVVVRFFTDGQHFDDDEPTPVARVIKRLGFRVHTVGCAATEEEVDGVLLRQIASTDEEGHPLYSFAGDKDGLRRVIHSASLNVEGPRS